jgi:hypothetical protein
MSIAEYRAAEAADDGAGDGRMDPVGSRLPRRPEGWLTPAPAAIAARGPGIPRGREGHLMPRSKVAGTDPHRHGDRDPGSGKFTRRTPPPVDGAGGAVPASPAPSAPPPAPAPAPAAPPAPAPSLGVRIWREGLAAFRR